jgi:subtilisin family serine protease
VALARLPFVQSVELVPVGRVSVDPEPFTPAAAPTPAASASLPAGVQFAPGDTGFYGNCFRQLQMMQVPAVHRSGNTGQGVLVCMLDAGFRLTHQVYAGLSVIARHDFVWGDSVVDDQVPPDQAGQGSHGTLTLSEVAGVLPGTFSGVAFGCNVALAKTEYVTTETPVEMDNWQFGAEWADSLGADVISSSLGYSQFDSPNPSYTYADMDGKTTVVTKAASEAMRRGITVVTANGNEAATPWHFLIAPADADTVIACGAVDTFNVVTGFSSRGPSADGRIKPDVTAMGSHTQTIAFTNPAGYGTASGTSLSTPLVAGAAALVLSAHPTWGPFEVREALRETALNHAAPDNNIGWGLVQVQDAIAWVPSTTGVSPGPSGTAVALAAAPNPFRAGAGTVVRLAPHASSTLDAFDARGRRVARLYEGASVSPVTVRWSGRGAAGQRLPAGVYWLRLSTAPAASARVVLLP